MKMSIPNFSVKLFVERNEWQERIRKRQNCVSYQTVVDEKAITHKIYRLLPTRKHILIYIYIYICILFMEGKYLAAEKSHLKVDETYELCNWFLFVVTSIMY